MFLFNCINFKFLFFLFTSLKTDLIRELLPLPLDPHSKALFVKLPSEKFTVLFNIVFFCLSTPTRRSKSYFEDVISEYVSRRDLLVEGLNKIDGVFCPKPTGAFYAIAQLPIDDADKFCQWLLEKFDLNGETVMLAPAAGFYASNGIGINQVRIAYVLNQNSLKSAINILAEALKIYPGRNI